MRECEEEEEGREEEEEEAVAERSSKMKKGLDKLGPLSALYIHCLASDARLISTKNRPYEYINRMASFDQYNKVDSCRVDPALGSLKQPSCFPPSHLVAVPTRIVGYQVRETREHKTYNLRFGCKLCLDLTQPPLSLAIMRSQQASSLINCSV
ncbi:uncharacterized protein MCYG_02868 [Microsporum canis CBS 113480]|uniref:Uncharacterized protein n=1 Tax=Arthroderma otae (strain ATCC MYA-4605 / CBS 113480) TaxID=554155 RepID=C5FK27_ARTOC|nr:uncharacterized protein MCYG_02868 [Microsporum canis CBS 113480]EEQ30049.1 predicted protein [Microsporum canis CBS 113480]